MAVEPTVRPHTIELKKSSGTRYDEGVATVTDIMPGMLIEKATGNNVIVHATQGGAAEVMIAREDALQGKTINQAYEYDPAGDASEPGDIVGYGFYLPGDEVFALIDAEADITENDELTSAGDGYFEAAGSADKVLLKALETLDLTGLAAAHIRARVVPQYVKA